MNSFEKAFLNTPEQLDSKAESHRNLEKIIDEMTVASPYQRIVETPAVEKISAKDKEDERFFEVKELTIEHIKNPESQKVEALVEFMEKFEPEEADTPEIIRDAIANETDAYTYHIIENNEGKVVAHAQTSFLNVESPKEGEKADKTIIFGGFIITADEVRRKRLASEVFQSALRCNLEKAKKRNKEVEAIIVEGKATSEKFWNSVGLRRLYFEDAQGNYNEAPYLQPPIQWDKKTGKPMDPETGKVGKEDIHEYSVPEHLMLRMINGKKELTVDELIPMINVIYKDNYTLYRNEGEKYPTDKAIDYTVNAVKQFQSELLNSLKDAKEGKLIILDAKEREEKINELKAQGKNFNEIITEVEEEENKE